MADEKAGRSPYWAAGNHQNHRRRPLMQRMSAPAITATTDYKGVKSGLVYNGASAMTNCHLNYIAAPSGTGTITNKYALVTEANAGSVGIGTTSPRGAFDVDGSGDIYLVDDPSAATSQSLYLPGHIYLAPMGETNISYLQARRKDNSGTSELQIRTWNSGTCTEAIRVLGDGNVGIGQTSPGAKLDVNGDVKFSTQGVKLNAGTTNPTTTGVAGNVGDLYVYINGTSSNLYIKTNTGNTDWSPCKN